MKIEQEEYIQFLKRAWKDQLTLTSRTHTLLEKAVQICSIENVGRMEDIVNRVLEGCKDEFSNVEGICIGIFNEQMNNWRHFGVSFGLSEDALPKSEWLNMREEQLPQRLEKGFLAPLKHQDIWLGVLAVIETADAGGTIDDVRRRQAYVEDLARIVSVAINNGFIVEEVYEPFEGIVGNSPAIRNVIEKVNQVADSNATILIQGEPGVGKELIARMIHERSSRRTRPYVAFNCAAITDALADSELFGHERGAFTSADRQKLGKFEIACDGTLFLDEVGEMSPSIQAKLSRALDPGEYSRVGSEEEYPLKRSARVVAATNKDLEDAVKKGAFREDLYGRLNAITIHVPPLRERKDDIPDLADHFLKQNIEDNPNGPKTFTPKALKWLMSYDWPGNIRQLKNAVEYAFLLEKTKVITPESLPDYVTKRYPDEISDKVKSGGLKEAVAAFEKQIVLQTLNKCGGNVTKAAKELQIARTTLIRHMKNLGLEAEDFRD